MRPVLRLLPLVIIQAISGSAFAQESDAWLITRRTTFARYGLHCCAVLPSGTAIQVCAVKKGDVESSLGGWVPITDLMTPASAIDLYTQRIENSPSQLDVLAARIALGKSYFAAQRFSQAIGEYNAVLRLEPRNADALLHRGMARERIGATELALADFDAALKTRPHFLEAWYCRCLLNARSGRLEAALTDLGSIARLNNRSWNGPGYNPATRLRMATRIVQQHLEIRLGGTARSSTM